MNRGLLGGLLLLAAGLRVGRALLRWDEVALAYAAYQAPLVDALDDPARLPGLFVGLHPPLYGVIFAAWERLLPIPLLLLGFSATCSFLAVVLVGRAARHLGGTRAEIVAVGLAGTAPVGLHYAAEVNNYPLTVLFVAALLLAWARYRSGRGGWIEVAATGVLAAWSHVIGGAAAGFVALAVLARHPGDGVRVFLALALGSCPVLAGAGILTGDPHTFGQPDLLLGASLRDWRDRFGVLAVPAGLLAVFGVPRAPAVALGWAGLAVLVGGMVALGVAAPHQFPYWSLLGPAAALLAGLGSLRHRVIATGAAVLVLAQAAVAVREEATLGRRIRTDLGRERAVDVALAAMAPGDLLWLLSPALEPDDDKRAVSPVLWRIHPWHPQPMARDFPFDYTDYQYGQPRRFGAFTVHTFTDLWPDRMDAIVTVALEQGHRVWVALYDHGPARAYPERLERVLRPFTWTREAVGTDVGLGVDLLYLVTGDAAGDGVP